MRKPARLWTAGVAGIALATTALSGCGLGSSSSATGPCQDVKAGSVDSSALKNVKVKVGSKEFDEQLLLGQLTLKMMCAAGANALDETDTKGSTQTRQKLLRGGSDVYWDYTGTGWITYLGHDKPIPDAQKMYDSVKKEDLAKNNLVWGPLAPFNNTYAFAVSNDFEQKTGVKTDSDMAAYLGKNPGSTVCVESEFAARPDGYPGYKKAYGITGGKTKSLGTGVVYTQTAKGGCDFGEVFTTDGRIKALNLTVLDDDKSFFPLYNGVPIVRKETNQAHPEILQVLKPLADTLTTDVMAQLNAKVSAEGQDPSKVAVDYLKKQGFLK